ncbi:MAG: response regulator transcription factor [Candidatus Hydrothermarchaeaceae archaeon]
MAERKNKILVVDDEPDIVFTIQKILENEGYEVITANDGKAALEKLKTVRADLILLDVMMPGVDGWNVCKILKEHEKTKSIPIAILTGLSKDIDKLTSLDLALADRHINKPVDKEDLIKTVKLLLKN